MTGAHPPEPTQTSELVRNAPSWATRRTRAHAWALHAELSSQGDGLPPDGKVLLQALDVWLRSEATDA